MSIAMTNEGTLPEGVNYFVYTIINSCV